MGHCNFKYEGITGKMTIKLRLGEGERMSWGHLGRADQGEETPAQKLPSYGGQQI